MAAKRLWVNRVTTTYVAEGRTIVLFLLFREAGGQYFTKKTAQSKRQKGVAAKLTSQCKW